MIIINFKTYKQGRDVIKLAKQIGKVNKKVIICVQAVYIKDVSKNTKLKVYAQHVAGLEKGKGTGQVIPEAVKAQGAYGSLLNHSEHPLYMEEIIKSIKLCKKNKLKVICCVSRLRDVKHILDLNPDVIAFEDPNLVGTGKSITDHNPRAIKKFIKIVSTTNIPAICGAGISNKRDIKAAYDLGCQGVLIASAITKKGKLDILREEK